MSLKSLFSLSVGARSWTPPKRESHWQLWHGAGSRKNSPDDTLTAFDDIGIPEEDENDDRSSSPISIFTSPSAVSTPLTAEEEYSYSSSLSPDSPIPSSSWPLDNNGYFPPTNEQEARTKMLEDEMDAISPDYCFPMSSLTGCTSTSPLNNWDLWTPSIDGGSDIASSDGGVSFYPALYSHPRIPPKSVSRNVPKTTPAHSGDFTTANASYPGFQDSSWVATSSGKGATAKEPRLESPAFSVSSSIVRENGDSPEEHFKKENKSKRPSHVSSSSSKPSRASFDRKSQRSSFRGSRSSSSQTSVSSDKENHREFVHEARREAMNRRSYSITPSVREDSTHSANLGPPAGRFARSQVNINSWYDDPTRQLSTLPLSPSFRGSPSANGRNPNLQSQYRRGRFPSNNDSHSQQLNRHC